MRGTLILHWSSVNKNLALLVWANLLVVRPDWYAAYMVAEQSGAEPPL